MRRSMKNRLTALLALCLCACICLALPAAASADVTLDKLLVAMPTTPIAYMPAGNISASSSTEGCSVQSLVWYDASGSQLSGTFGTQNYTVEIVVSLAEGYSLASDARVYLNNSAVDYTVNGSSVTLRREYAAAIASPIFLTLMMRSPFGTCTSSRTCDGMMQRLKPSLAISESR